MGAFIDPPSPFGSTKQWKDFLAQAEAEPVKSSALLSTIDEVKAEPEKRAKYQGHLYWVKDSPEDLAKV